VPTDRKPATPATTRKKVTTASFRPSPACKPVI
jgi:hypothetical protein